MAKREKREMKLELLSCKNQLMKDMKGNEGRKALTIKRGIY